MYICIHTYTTYPHVWYRDMRPADRCATAEHFSPDTFYLTFLCPRYGTRGQMCHSGAFLEHISRGIRWISGAIMLSPVRGGLKNSSR